MSLVYSGAVTKLSPPKKVSNNLIFFGVWCWGTHSSPQWNDNTYRGAAHSWKKIKQVVNGKTNPTRGPVQVFQLRQKGHQRTESADMWVHDCYGRWFLILTSTQQLFSVLQALHRHFKFHVSTEQNVWTGEDQGSNKIREFSISNENIMRIFYKTKGEILNKLFDHRSGQTADWLQMFLSSVWCIANVTSLSQMWLIAGMLTMN